MGFNFIYNEKNILFIETNTYINICRISTCILKKFNLNVIRIIGLYLLINFKIFDYNFFFYWFTLLM